MGSVTLTQAPAAALGSREELRFADLVREHQAMVYSIAYHFLNDSAVAEELAQEVFLQLYRHLPRLESPRHVTNWLRRVTCHRAIDLARKRAGVRELELESAPEPAVAPAEPDPLLDEKLRRLVASLPEKQRLLVILRYQEEMELAEIAELLGMRLPTVRTQLFRTLALLRKKAARLLGSIGSPRGRRHGEEVD